MVFESESESDDLPAGDAGDSSSEPIRFIDESGEVRVWGADRKWANSNRDAQLKQAVKYGVCLWWSDQVPSWIHPEDIEIAKRLVPGGRIFRKEECVNCDDRELGYSFMWYGDEGFRALPAIWLEIRHEGFELNDFVEIKSGFGKRFRGIGTIRDIVWDRHRRKIEYLLTINGQKIDRTFHADEIQPATRLGSHLNSRELENANRARWA